MTTSPDTVRPADTVHQADAASAARPAALTEQTPAPGATFGEATRTPSRTPRPDFADEPTSTFQRFLVGLFVAVPLVALIAAIPLMWGWGLDWHAVVIALVFYWVSGLGVTVGYHRYFTHGSFKAKTGLRVAMAIAGSLAIEGPVITWVSDHRRHHKFSDREGDPHSPWRYGEDWKALTKGLAYAHIGWLFDPHKTSQEKFSPDLLADQRIRRVDHQFPALVAISLLLPALIGGLWGLSWQGALTAFFWASLVRIALLHHVTWSINSVCHFFGRRRFAVEDESRNVFWLAPFSMGEAWHHNHHAFPTSAFHGLRFWERVTDPTGLLIVLLEKLGLVWNVVRISPERQAAKLAAGSGSYPSSSGAIVSPAPSRAAQ